MNKIILTAFIVTVAVIAYVNSECYKPPAKVTKKQTTFLWYAIASFPSQSVKLIPGIGKVYGGRLIGAGYPNISSLFEVYSEMQKFNESAFCDWLQTTARMSSYYATMTADAFYLKAEQVSLGDRARSEE